MRNNTSFLKWAGSKGRLFPTLQLHLTPATRLIEPFVGSCAVFLGVAGRYDRYVLGDANPDLIGLYRHLSADPGGFIADCAELFVAANNDEARYLALRAEFNRLPTGTARRAALFVYLNRHSFNGLCRYNTSGSYNVAFGRYAAPSLPEMAMRAFADRVSVDDVELVHADFRQTILTAAQEDLVFLDPPYLPAGKNAAFAYTPGGGFDLDDHRDLAAAAWAAAGRGARVVVSSSDVPAIHQLYAGARIYHVSVNRSISCKAGGRGMAAELIIVIEPRRLALAA